MTIPVEGSSSCDAYWRISPDKAGAHLVHQCRLPAAHTGPCRCACSAAEWVRALSPEDNEAQCPDCKGTGIMGGPGSYYDQPGYGKPCGTCNGHGTIRVR